MFYIQREPVPGQIRQIARWLTNRGGWSSNFANAKRFLTRAEAAQHIRGYKKFGVIIEIGVDLPKVL